MADNAAKINIDTSVDLKNLKDELGEAEKEVSKSAEKQMAAVQEGARKQVEAIRSAEKEKIAEIQKSLAEQIAAAKKAPGVDKATLNAQIKAIKDTENAKIKAIKAGAKLQETEIKKLADKNVKAISDYTKKQLKLIQDANKNSLDSIKDFVKSAGKELLGMDQVLGAMAGGPAALASALVSAGKQAISTLNEWGQASLQAVIENDKLNAVLKSTGANAWTTVSQLNQLAKEQSAATGKSSEEITAMQTVLLGFRSVTKNVFADTTQAALDMSAVMGGDLVGAANMLGKAIDTPVEGMSALGRVGFVFTEQQKEQVKALEESGKHMEAQRLILDEVQSTFSGASTATNVLVRAQMEYNDALDSFKKTIGESWLQIIRTPMEAATNILNSFTGAINDNKEFGNWISDFGKASQIVEEMETAMIRLDADYQKLDNSSRAARAGMHESEKAKLEENLKTSDEYMYVLQEEMRMLEVLDSMRNGGREGVDYSAMEKRRAKEWERQYREWYETEIDIENAMNERRIKMREAQIAIEAKMQREAAAAAEAERIAALVAREKEKSDLIKENQDALDAEIERIKRRAEIEGKSVESLEVQKQILDAEIQSYENLLHAAREYIDVESEDEQARINDFKRRWAEYERQKAASEEAKERAKRNARETEELEKKTDEARKKRLEDLAKQQEALARDLKKIWEDAYKTAQNLSVEAERKDISKVSKTDPVAAIRMEADLEKRLLAEESEAKRVAAIKNYSEQSVILEELQAAELNNANLTEERKSEIQAAGEAKRREQYDAMQQSLTQINENEATKRAEIEAEAAAAGQAAIEEMWNKRIGKAKEYLDAINGVANDISTIWHNSIDYELEEELRANKERIQSDEERAENEKKIRKKAAEEKYKADLFAYAASIITATGQAALGVLAGLASAGIPGAIAAGVIGAISVAAVASAVPKRPSFHTGGVVQGLAGQEVPTTLLANEKVLTEKQFADTMMAISNLAQMTPQGGGGVALNVNIENNAPNTKVDTAYDSDELRIVIREVVNSEFASGGLDQGVSRKEIRDKGKAIV